MPRYKATFTVCYQCVGDSRCESPKYFQSLQYFDEDTVDKGMEVARRLRRDLKDDFTYSVTLDSLVEVQLVA